MTLHFIIFGWPKRTKDIGPSYYVECANCNNAVMYWLVKERRWFSLFFIPVLPLSAKRYHLECEACSVYIEIEKGELANAKLAADLVKQLEAGELSEDECFDEINRLADESTIFGREV